MFPNEFDYARPSSLQEALTLLQQNPEAKLLAGGHSLLPAMKLRLAAPSMLIDISRLPELKGVRANGSVTVGAGTTYSEIAQAADLQQSAPMLVECALNIGDPMVRNKGTIGGSLAHSDPAADMPAVVLALGAELKALGPGGERTIAADSFFTDMLQTALEPGEVLTEVTLPQRRGKVGMAYEKFKHPASGYAIVGVAALVELGADGSVSDARIAVTGAGPKAQRASAAESALKGGDAAGAAAKASDGLEYIGDMSASEEYRAHLVRVLTKRAVQRAMEQAK